MKAQLHDADKTIHDIQSTMKTVIDEHHMELNDLVDTNRELQDAISNLERELSDKTLTQLTDDSTPDFTITTKDGNRYLNSVRELYYSLMALGTSPEKIDIIIRTVLGKLCPTIDTSTLKLPKKSCANYMRMAEMPTVSNVHKATKLTELPQGHMNTDGTTLNLKKLVGSSVSGLVLGVQEVADGTSQTMIDELDKQLQSLRELAKELKLPNANAINWTLMVSSTSDGAATQTKFTRLLEGLRARDEGIYGPPDNLLKEVVANKCGMHLGVNLRKAQNQGKFLVHYVHTSESIRIKFT